MTATGADLPDNMLTRDQLQTILKRILFEPEPKGTDFENIKNNLHYRLMQHTYI